MIMHLREKFPFSRDHQKTLRGLVIEAQQPGLILADFQQLLDFIGPDGVPVTGTGLLSLKLLRPLNERLTRSLALGLRRPQQKSYPHINGLYLLLRATGLGQFDLTAAKPRLVIDPTILSSWTSLTPTEQYLTLLETWLLRGQPEVIGEDQGSSWFDSALVRWAYLFKKVPETGLAVADDNAQADPLRYWPGLYNLALLELFGMVRIEDGPVVTGSGWQIERVWRTAGGDAWLACLLEVLDRQTDDLIICEEPSEIPFGSWQPALQPYFPGWQHTLTFPAEVFRTGVFIFKVGLWQDKVWRRLAIPAEFSLEELAWAIIKAFEFDFDHLYRFSYPNRFGAMKQVAHPHMEEGPATTEVQVGELPLVVGSALEFVYDFGDCWEFSVTLEEIEPPDPQQSRVELRAVHGQAPAQYDWGEVDFDDDDELD